MPGPISRIPRRAAWLLISAAGMCGLASMVQPAHAADEGTELCATSQPGVRCQPGQGRQTPGGAGKVSHAGWPPITGELLIIDNQGRRAEGGPLNDEILGGHGSDTLVGKAGRDVLWGDQWPTNNNSWQRDTLWAGPGKDIIYPSHGTNVVFAGSGADIVRAYYGHGTIDCGPGNDTAQVRENGAYRLRSCEHVVHFCAHGSDKHGKCLKPGQAKTSRTTPRAT